MTDYRYRISLHRSNRLLTAQIVDDRSSKTLVAIAGQETPKAKNKMDQAKLAGKILAEKAIKLGIKKVFLDRKTYRYHGRVKVFSDSLRENGMEF